MPRTREELFWLAFLLVALVFVMMLAKCLPVFAPKTPRRPWLAVLLLAIGGCAHSDDRQRLEMPRWRSEGSAGWSSPYMPADGHPFTARHALQRV